MNDIVFVTCLMAICGSKCVLADLRSSCDKECDIQINPPGATTVRDPQRFPDRAQGIQPGCKISSSKIEKGGTTESGCGVKPLY
jgi:hypothetical protein